MLAGRIYRRTGVARKERLTVITGQLFAVTTICLLVIPALLSFPMPPPTRFTTTTDTPTSPNVTRALLPITQSYPALSQHSTITTMLIRFTTNTNTPTSPNFTLPRLPVMQSCLALSRHSMITTTISPFIGLAVAPTSLSCPIAPPVRIQVDTTTVTPIASSTATTASTLAVIHSCPTRHTMTTDMIIPPIGLAVVPTNLSCPIPPPIHIKLGSTSVTSFASPTTTIPSNAYRRYCHQSQHNPHYQYYKQHLSYSSKCHRAIQWCHFQQIEKNEHFHLKIKWPGNGRHFLPLSTICWIATVCPLSVCWWMATVCFPWTVFSVLATATAALATAAVTSVLCSATALLALCYCMLMSVLCAVVICILLGELTCRILDRCIPLMLATSTAAVAAGAVMIVVCTAVVLVALGYCMFTTLLCATVSCSLVVKVTCRTLDRCIPIVRPLTPLSRLYRGLITVSSAALTCMAVFATCWCTLCLLAAEAGPRMCIIIAAKAVWCRSSNASARFKKDRKLQACKIQKRADQHKNKRQRSRGRQWIREHWNDKKHAPARVHVSIQHPDVGPFRFETVVPVTQTVQEFVKSTGLSNAIVRTSDSHTVLTPARTFADYGFMPGSVICLRATFMPHNAGLLGGASCEFVSEGGISCEEPAADDAYCEHHAHPLRGIVELGNECDRLDTVVSFTAMQARATILLDQLNAMAVPDEPLALSAHMSWLDSFNRLRDFRRAQLVYALQPRQGTRHAAHRSVHSRPAL
jgi:tetrahydromethanopterin S-methyltransferase subunit C